MSNPVESARDDNNQSDPKSWPTCPPAGCNYNPIKNQVRLNAENLTILDGPFHYQLRCSTYGELYDEIPWRVQFGIDKHRSRDAVDRTSLIGSFKNCTLIHNWSEERRDREYIRTARSPISQYGHLYKTTYNTTIGNKRMCNKERYALKQIQQFPTYTVPIYQPELDPKTIKYCFPKPEECIAREVRDAYFKEIEREKRVAKAAQS